MKSTANVKSFAKKRSKIAIVISCSLAICILPVALFLYFGVLLTSTWEGVNGLRQFLSEWKPAEESPIAQEEYEKVLIRGEEFDLEAALAAHYSRPNLDVDTVLCIFRGRVYGLEKRSYDSTTGKGIFDLYSVEIDTGKVRILLSEELQGAAQKTGWLDLLRGTVYYDGRILLWDSNKTIVWNLNTETRQECSLAQAADMMPRLTAERNAEEGYTLTDGEKYRHISLEHLIERNEYLQKAQAEEIKMQMNGNFILDGKPYFRVCLFDDGGRCSAAMFSYDWESEAVEYLFYVFTNGLPHGTPIPIVED